MDEVKFSTTFITVIRRSDCAPRLGSCRLTAYNPKQSENPTPLRLYRTGSSSSSFITHPLPPTMAGAVGCGPATPCPFRLWRSTGEFRSTGRLDL
jgi:hypothetical protein